MFSRPLLRQSISASGTPGTLAGMRNYRHNRVPGRSYFFTVRLADPHSTLLTEHIAAFGAALRRVRFTQPFHIDAWVVLHDHAHAIWTLPPGDHDYGGRWRAVKIAFSRSVRASRPPGAPLWQRHIQQRPISDDDDDYRRMVDYVHANPVSHGMCLHPAEWPWSSVHRFMAEGWIASSGRPC
ncbi:MAG: transposase [Pseudomonadota bacterium]